VYLLNGMFVACLYSLLCICFNVVCVCDFMLNIWSPREEYKFQLFLFLRIPARSAAKVHKECVDKFMRF
jgi:hypothetical protein